MQKIISLYQGVVRQEKWRMTEPVNFEMEDGENIAIIGPNGGGKSMFIDILTGAHPIMSGSLSYNFAPSKKPLVSDNIKYICFKDSYGGDNDSTYYLQQRWNQTEIDESTYTVGKKIETAYKATGEDNAERREMKERIINMFSLNESLDKYVIMLSSGELRKLSIAIAIFSQPRLLIIDNPFIGLDSAARQQLSDLLTNIANKHHIQILLVVNRLSDIPQFITHVVEVRDMKVGCKIRRSDYKGKTNVNRTVITNSTKRITGLIRGITKNCTQEGHNRCNKTIVYMNDVTIKYGIRTILSHLSWEVKNGECWALTGQNGSGKSTLLSLICADNPQSYACNITLFGRPRGSGESIWDIKKHIGYVSPEMHRAFRTNVVTEQIVASGFSNVMGLYRKPTKQQLEESRIWMDIFGISNTEGRKFLELSSGEQRMALLARAFVKNPELLVLDEPFHGLDDNRKESVRFIIDEFCKHKNKTLIMVSHYKEEYPKCISNQLTLTRN